MCEETRDSKVRILQAAEELFSERGFNGTRVNDIAELAGVNKALIYYYFKSKEAILQVLIDALILEMRRESVKAIEQDKYQMFGNADTTFVNLDEETINRYLDMAIREMIAFCLERKRIFRIVLMESLTKDLQHSPLFQIIDLMGDESMSAVFQEKGIQLEVDKSDLVEAFFIRLMPLISFTVYYDEWKAANQMSDDALISAFIQSFRPIYYQSLQPLLK